MKSASLTIVRHGDPIEVLVWLDDPTTAYTAGDSAHFAEDEEIVLDLSEEEEAREALAEAHFNDFRRQSRVRRARDEEEPAEVLSAHQEDAIANAYFGFRNRLY